VPDLAFTGFPPRRSTAQHAHLYVAGGSAESSASTGFPISDGLPATTPDDVLTGGNLSYPISVAFDGAAYEYVSDLNEGLIKVYAPGASGNAQPLRILPVHFASEIAVNRAGYLFVVDANFSIEAFAPEPACRRYRRRRPLFSFGGFPETAFNDLLVDSAGPVVRAGILRPDLRLQRSRPSLASADRIIATNGHYEGSIPGRWVSKRNAT